MVLLEAVRRTRAILDDFGGDVAVAWETDDTYCRWKNLQIVEWLEDARTQACLRRPIRDASSELTSATLAADALGRLELDPRILAVRTVRLDAESQPLAPVLSRQLDKQWPDWRTAVGDPRYWVADADEGDAPQRVVVLVPDPQEDTDVRLELDRLPLTPLDWDYYDEEIGDIHAGDQADLCYWAAAKAMEASEDDLKRSAVYEARFDRRFGPPVTTQQLAVRALQRAGVLRVRSHGF